MAYAPAEAAHHRRHHERPSGSGAAVDFGYHTRRRGVIRRDKRVAATVPAGWAPRSQRVPGRAFGSVAPRADVGYTGNV